MTNTLYCDDYKKQCPVCGAFTFENARLCYGCMYRFNDDAGINMHSLTATGTSSLERVSGSAPTSLPQATGAPASPSVEIGACAFSCVSAAPPVASSAAMSAPASPPVAPPVPASAPASLSIPASAPASPPVASSAAMDASVYTCVPATTSTDAYVQRLPCEPGNCFSSYKTY